MCYAVVKIHLLLYFFFKWGQTIYLNPKNGTHITAMNLCMQVRQWIINSLTGGHSVFVDGPFWKSFDIASMRNIKNWKKKKNQLL